MKKRWIEDSAISGVKLDLQDVASIDRCLSRRVKTVKLRHSWPENATDGRVWDGISAALKRGARELMLADSRINVVQVWSHNAGWLVRDFSRDDVGLA